ncbi:DUF1156 domain-containing protein [Vibrio splendidus]|uniref:DUF1156 domain-containing protein n=1 Tax=Vibrio splendidus TaxID=29497 RepID=UPI001F52CF96|nr:hypothetical protein [Vibrio splendidus]
MFTKRQLVALNTFSELIHEARKDSIERAVKSGLIDDGKGLKQGGESATAYGDAIAIYLALALGRAADYWTSLATWENKGEFVAHAFTKQAIPMVWDFADSNPFSNASGNWEQTCVSWVARVIDNLPAQGVGVARQADAQTQDVSVDKVISTDPPYYDNIAYADLADYFYVWMRKTLRDIDPGLFATISVPKSDELVASSHRHGGKSEAEEFFMNGMSRAIERVQSQCHPAFPVSIYYAFKQSETKDDSTSNTGWETFLESVIQSGFSIDGTWPLRTERTVRTVAIKANALASSILLVCRKRSGSGNDDSMISRRQFQRELKADMPEALEAMIGGESGQSPIAPVDLAQAAIGPGMAIYSKYDAVLNQDGSKMSVHDALIMINKEITDYLNPDAGVYDADTLFCSDWFDQYGWSQGEFGIADTLARAKGTSVEGVHEAGVIETGAGKVRLLRWEDMDNDWDPKSDNRVPVWEACHQIIRELNQKGESAAGALLARMPEHGEAIRQLAYHMYTLCERKKWAEDARAYNELITAWHSVVEASLEAGHKNEQMGFDL